MPIDPKRVIKLREKLGLTQGQLSKKVGMKQQGISSIEEGNSARPRRLRELAAALETSEAYLLGETNNPALTGFEIIPVDTALWITGEVAAGRWLEIDLTFEPTERVPFVPVLGMEAGSLFALKVRGDSVDKEAPDGSVIICLSLAESGIAIQNGDLVVVERRREQEGLREVTVKRFFRRRNGVELVPESTNPRWKPVFMKDGSHADEEEMRIIGRVEFVLKKPSRP